MKFELFPTPYLTASQITELASSLDLVHARVLKAIERLNRDIEARKVEIANRWKTMDVSDADRRRFVSQENEKAISTIRENAKKELDGLFKEAGGLHGRVVDQRPFYASKVMVLNRQGLGTEKRAQYERTAEKARPVSLAGLIQFAIGTSDTVMTAALVQENDARREGERGFSTLEALKLVRVDEYDKAQEFFALAEVRFQAVVLAIRTWNMGRSNPISTVALALRKRELENATANDGADDE